MKEKGIVLGIDTSNYTTSVALMYEDGELISNFKHPLTVRSGERGLRQSDAVFSHTVNIRSLMDDVRTVLGGRIPSAIGVSTRPRNIDGSYMPCFLSGFAVANGISAATGSPLYCFSHQCGHIMAALYSSGKDVRFGERFAAYHVSGGTTELLDVTRVKEGFSAELVGGTRDLKAGQLIDRIGVLMGLPFPSGSYIESLAKSYTGKRYCRKVPSDGSYFNLSGGENIAKKLYSDTADSALVADFVLRYIAEAIDLSVSSFFDTVGNMPIVFAGGVMSNGIIRNELEAKYDSYFAEPALSADNAVGIAELARKEHYCIE